MASTTYRHLGDVTEMFSTQDQFRGITKMICDFVGLNKIDYFAVLGNMVRNAGQLPHPFWIGAACGGGSRSDSRCAART